MKQIRLRKIPLESFIDTLIDLYEHGVLYVDLIADPGENIDRVGIYVKDEYMDDGMFPKLLNKKITDDDINQLLN